MTLPPGGFQEESESRQPQSFGGLASVHEFGPGDQGDVRYESPKRPDVAVGSSLPKTTPLGHARGESGRAGVGHTVVVGASLWSPPRTSKPVVGPTDANGSFRRGRPAPLDDISPATPQQLTPQKNAYAVGPLQTQPLDTKGAASGSTVPPPREVPHAGPTMYQDKPMSATALQQQQQYGLNPCGTTGGHSSSLARGGYPTYADAVADPSSSKVALPPSRISQSSVHAGPTVYLDQPGGQKMHQEDALPQGKPQRFRSPNDSLPPPPPPRSFGGLAHTNAQAGPTIFDRGDSDEQAHNVDGRGPVAVVSGRSLSPSGQEVHFNTMNAATGQWPKQGQQRGDETLPHSQGAGGADVHIPASTEQRVEGEALHTSLRPPRDLAPDGGNEWGSEAERQEVIAELHRLDQRLLELRPQVQALRAQRQAANEDVLQKVRHLEYLLLPPQGLD